ncbi:MAG TPA: hypothetical protein VIJ57_09730, partial [Hanamia sp.]
MKKKHLNFSVIVLKKCIRKQFNSINFALISTILILLSTTAFSQQITFNEIVNKIQAQESFFPLPQNDTIITIGNINLNINAPIINYNIPITDIQQYYYAGEREGNDLRPHAPPGGWVVGSYFQFDTIRTVNFSNVSHIKLRFTVSNWAPENKYLTITIGSEKKTILNGENEVIFSNFAQLGTFNLSCYTSNQKQTPARNLFITNRYEITSLQLIRNTIGAGIISIPVLPVKIIYAPVLDLKAMNYSSTAKTIVKGYTTTLSYTNVNNIVSPVPTTLTTIDNISKDMDYVGQALSLWKGTAAYGKALSTTSKLIQEAVGSQTRTQTNSNTVNSQNSISINDSETHKIKAKVINGGPGDGDIFCFYTNAKIVWFANNGKMQLALLGYDLDLKSTSAKDLKDELASLRNKPKGTKDLKWKLDSATLASLLNLDPFT